MRAFFSWPLEANSSEEAEKPERGKEIPSSENAGAAYSSGNDALDIPEARPVRPAVCSGSVSRTRLDSPAATMPCGAPRGYFVADFKRNGKYSLAYKAVLVDDVALGLGVG